MRRLMIIGAREGSLGAEIRDQSEKFHDDFEVVTAGINDEDVRLDVKGISHASRVIEMVKPTDILCTVGVNISEPVESENFWYANMESMMVNYIGVMTVLKVALDLRDTLDLRSFVAISSNSAQIARRNSAPYCASKAALSMGLRCAAREQAGRPLIYGYELGLLAGTPMTQATEEVFGPAQSRMVGAEKGLEVSEVASAVLANLRAPWMGLNGSMLRLDAGEQ